MIIKVILKSLCIIFMFTIILFPNPSSYADSNAYTVDILNNHGGYTSIIITRSGTGFTGPQGEYYPQFPSVAQLRVMYGVGAPDSTGYVSNSAGGVTIVTTPPPSLPVYEQPAPPDPAYIWTPGYWAYNSFWQDYYWVPGTWVAAPYDGYLWTPGYWYWRNGHYVFSNGYWGPHVGFYGGINYGFGYSGVGLVVNWRSGGWNHGGAQNGGGNNGNTYATNITNNYNTTNNVTNSTSNNTTTNTSNSNSTASYNGGPGGIQAKPTPAERAAMKEKHLPPTPAQKQHMRAAAKNPALRASVNHGRPAIAATAKPGVFKGKGVVSAQKAGGAEYHKTDASAKRAAVTHRNSKQNARLKARPRAKPRTKPVPKAKPGQNAPAANGQNPN